MVFSSVLFLFFFLPFVLAGYYLLPFRQRNGFLLIVSLLFYAWGEVLFSLVMLTSITLNYGLGRWLENHRDPKIRKRIVIVAVVGNLLLLGVFKYLGFLVESINPLLSACGFTPFKVPALPLPLGISFFTFHAFTYILEVYRGTVPVQRRWRELGLYITFFPQLVAGPIVRYKDVLPQIGNRQETVDRFYSGVIRFLIGLSKKILLANPLGATADLIFALPTFELTTSVTWLGVLCYTLQIYFDFSGYSDMAIGLGRMFGFEFMENFNYPYIAQSVQDFWRRWHISLSSFFRDYVYIPLGGNRGGFWKTTRNLMIVFFLCGLWHGASWTFVIWGLFHGFFLMLERLGWSTVLQKIPSPVRHGYTLLVVSFGWVLFRADTFPQAIEMMQNMLGFSSASQRIHPVALFLHPEIQIALFLGIVGATPIVPMLQAKIQQLTTMKHTLRGFSETASWIGTACLFLCFFVSVMKLYSSSHNPFIYFRF